MDVRLDAEQRALRDSVAQVVANLGPSTVAALDDSERSAKLDAAVAASGWRELRTADESGTPWASGIEVAVIAEQLGQGLADTSFIGPTLAAELRRVAGATPATGPETVLLTDDLVGGTTAFDAAGADAALVLVPAEGGHRLGTLALGPAGVRSDLTRPGADVEADAAELVDEHGRVLDQADLDRALALGLAATAADLVGVMQGATDLAAGYAKERRQYGAPIGSFQAVQHLLADALVLTEGSRSTALYAAWAVDALEPGEALAAAATAKAYATRAARQVCETAIQVHGGIGNTWECLAHVYLRRALLSGDAFGGVDANLARVLDATVGGR